MTCRALQRQFTELGVGSDEGSGSDEEGAQVHALSLFALTGRMTRRQAAKLFYQICGACVLPWYTCA